MGLDYQPEGVVKFAELNRRAVEKMKKGGHVDAFLKIDGIEGESVDKSHGKELQILGFEIGASQKGTAGSGSGGAGAGKARVSDFMAVAKIDKSMPKLLLACITGQHIKSAILTVRKAGETPQDYLVATFSDFIVSEFFTIDSESEDAIPLMDIGINFAQVQVEYKEQKPDGSLGGAVKVGYNIAQNTKL